jgi:hypothetical protein
MSVINKFSLVTDVVKPAHEVLARRLALWGRRGATSPLNVALSDGIRNLWLVLDPDHGTFWA